jgi:hypothetical protein
MTLSAALASPVAEYSCPLWCHLKLLLRDEKLLSEKLRVADHPFP